LLFLKVRDALFARNESGPYPQGKLNGSKARSLAEGDLITGYSMGDSLRYWQQVRYLQQFADAYAAGSFDQAEHLLEQ